MNTDKSILFFKDDFEFLSNFYFSPFIWDGVEWSTVEHAFQASKAKYPDYKEMIRKSRTPAIAKKLGRKVILREDWEQVKISIMTELVWLKFDQNPELRSKLINTGTVELVEGNYWHDNFWGDCKCRKCQCIKGENTLGFILMEVRKRLGNE